MQRMLATQRNKLAHLCRRLVAFELVDYFSASAFSKAQITFLKAAERSHLSSFEKVRK
jgi:hypothetical protein